MSPTSRVLAALVAGLAIGVVVSWIQHPTLLSIVDAVEPIGALWVNAIGMTVIPLVVSLLVTGVASTSPGNASRIGGRALLLFGVLVTGGALLAALAAPALLALVPLDPSAFASLREAAPRAGGQVELPPFRDWVVALIPANPIRAAADGAMLFKTDGGVLRFDGREWSLTESGLLADMMVTTDGGVWAASHSGPSEVLRFHDDSWTHYSNREVGIRLPSGCWQDPDGTVWVAGDNRIAKFVDGRWHTYRPFETDRQLTGTTRGMATSRGDMDDDPIVFTAKDKYSWMIFGLVFVVYLLAVSGLGNINQIIGSQIGSG